MSGVVISEGDTVPHALAFCASLTNWSHCVTRQVFLAVPGCKNSLRSHAGPSLDWRRVVNILLAMTRSSLRIQTVCFGVIAALAFATAVPAWAQEEPSSEYVDPTIVKDETPEGVKNLGAEQAVTQKKWEYANPPVYKKWYFWAGTVIATAVVVILAVWPFTPSARGCTTTGSKLIPLNCYGDGR
jgi:hypothetical protein